MSEPKEINVSVNTFYYHKLSLDDHFSSSHCESDAAMTLNALYETQGSGCNRVS